MYVPLVVKSYYSLLSSMNRIEDIVSFCVAHGITQIGLCDNNLFGAMTFLHQCEKNHIHAILGLDITFQGRHLYCYASNYEGYQHLLKLSTIQSEREVTLEELKKFSSSLIVIFPFGSYDLAKELSFYASIYFGYSSLEEMKEAMLYGEIVFAPEVLYLEEEMKHYLPYLYMIRDGKTVDHEMPRITGIHHLIVDHLEYFSENTGILNTVKIASRCDIVFPKAKLLLPIYETGNGMDANTYLMELSKAGLLRRLDGKVPKRYLDRLYYELDVIGQMGYSNYFLVVYDYIKYAKKHGILVGPGRGSAAGSLVAYVLGITEIDPLQYDLLFERFLNPERVSMPDIDTDFPDVYRDQVIDYVRQKYGDKRVAGIITFGTLGAKQVIRDVSRVFNIPLYKVDALCKYIPTLTKWKLKDFYQKNDRFREMLENDPSLMNMYRLASRFEGFPRHTSSHAAGIVMSQVDLDDVVPLTKSDGMYLTGYTMEYLEELGLLKMDFLGLKNLTTIMRILEDIKQGEGVSIDFNRIPLDDKATLFLFETANTSGIFQFESSGMKSFLRQLKPNCFEDIFAAIALFRPGPASNIDTYVKRKHGEEKVTYLDPSLEPILKSTYGIPVYQEQIMQIAQVVAGYSLGQADILRRAISKKKMEVLEQEEARFLKQSVERGFSYDVAKEIFALILKFANYGFNRAHSVAYSIVSYKMAYLKAHYPKYFFTSLFTSVVGSEVKTKEYFMEARKNGISILKPDINLSFEKYTVEKEGIRFPLSNIQNVGVVTCQEILKARTTPFCDIFDFVSRVMGRTFSRKTIESLIDASCFDSFGYNHATLHFHLDKILNYADLAKDLDPHFLMKPELSKVDEFSMEELMAREKKVFGFYLSNHPASIYRFQDSKLVALSDLPRYFGKTVTVVVLLENYRVINTKKGERMAFFTGSDDTGNFEFTLFPKVYETYFPYERGKLLRMTGNIEKRYDQYQMIVSKIEKIEGNRK